MTDKCRLSIVIPCYNEESTLSECVDAVLAIQNNNLELEVIIVDDCSKDESPRIATELAAENSEIRTLKHDRNTGKGAALRTGFAAATGDFVAVQDADLEYDPKDLLRLIEPLQAGKADVVFGSRFASSGAHRVLYFWHAMGNRFLTLLSNMYTDLNLTDMETCYKVFRREVIQSINIEENRFGFEPEVVAKVAGMRCRVFEMGISYYGRTYAEGKKIGVRDGFRALYCILRYNSHQAPIAGQFLIYLVIGGLAALINLVAFLVMRSMGVAPMVSAITAFWIAAAFNYWLCIIVLFRHQAQWRILGEIVAYSLVVSTACVIDVGATLLLLGFTSQEWLGKLGGTLLALVANFAGRKFLVFREPARGPWQDSRNISGPKS